MKTIIELTPEWVLAELAESHFAGGEGSIAIYALRGSDAAWISLALNTLNISYDIDDYDYEENRELWSFVFSIEDLKSECPTLYERFKKMDEEEYRNQTS